MAWEHNHTKSGSAVTISGDSHQDAAKPEERNDKSKLKDKKDQLTNSGHKKMTYRPQQEICKIPDI